MDEETQAFHKDNPPKESAVMSVSVRGWLVIMTMYTVCLMEIFRIGISEPLYSMSLLMVGFYFGQNKPTMKQ